MKVGLIGFTTANLGDDLQSIATALNLPFVDRLVPRERFASLKLDEPHLCVMQSWFAKQRFRAPTAALDPVMFGYCFGHESMRFGQWPSYLRRHQPVGARDTRSVELLARLGIDAFWSGCLTLRIGGFLRTVPSAERSGVYLVDLEPEAEALVPPAIRERAARLSNEVPPDMHADPLARMAYIARLCDRLRRAELVITRRLHTGLPCVGFRTPTVMLVPDSKGNRHRFSGFDRFAPVHYYGADRPAPAIDWSNIGTVDILPELDARYAALRSDLAARLGAIGEARYDELFRRDRVELPNPGLGPKTGRVALDLGMARVERVPLAWSEHSVTVEIDGFASFERFRAPVLLQGHGRTEWVEAGRVDRLLGA